MPAVVVRVGGQRHARGNGIRLAEPAQDEKASFFVGAYLAERNRFAPELPPSNVAEPPGPLTVRAPGSMTSEALSFSLALRSAVFSFLPSNRL